MPLLLVLLLSLLLAASRLSPASPLTLPLHGASLVPTVGLLLLSLLFSGVLLTARSVTNLLSWHRALREVRQSGGSSGAVRALRSGTARWAFQAAALLVAFAFLGWLFLALLVTPPGG